MKVFWPVRLLSTAICGAVLLFFLVSLEGCSEKEPMISEFSDVPIAFISEDNWDALNADAAVGTRDGEGTRSDVDTRDGESTRSAVGTRDGEGATAGTAVPFDDGSEIGVFSYYTPKNSSNKDQFMFNEQVTFDGTIWTYEPVKYWPHSGSLDFYAYYPYKAGTAIHTIDIENHYTDYRWATPLTGRTEGPVAFVFHHALACIRLNVKSTAITGVKMKEVAFNDSKGKIPSGGKMNIESGAITGSAEVASIDFKEFKTEVILSSDAYQTSELYIPAYSGLADKQFNISFMFDIDNNDEDNYEPVSFALPAPANNEYTVGKRYTYNLDLKEDKTVEIVSIVIDEYEEVPVNVVMGKTDYYNSETNTYYVATEDYMLNTVVPEVNNGNLNRNIALVRDLDMTGKVWTPIGAGNGYTGKFEGNEHTVRGINISAPVHTKYLWGDNFEETTAVYECAGFMGYVAPGGVVQNIFLEDVEINVKGDRNNVDMHAGGIAGIIDGGTIENCHIENARIIGTAIDVLTNKQTTDGRLGGIVGMLFASSVVKGCSINGNLEVSTYGYSYIRNGGLCGYINGGNAKIIGSYINCHYNIYGESYSVFNGIAQAHLGGLIGMGGTTGCYGCYIKGDASSNINMGGSLTYGLSALGAIASGDISAQCSGCYWTATNSVTTPFSVTPPASPANVIQISDDNWTGAITNMNNAISSSCSLKYVASDRGPVLVPKN